MSCQVLFAEKAIKELSDSFDWYEGQQRGLGEKFERAVYERVSTIQQYPEAYPQKRKPYREVRLKRFPFLIIYEFDASSDTILVVSIFHTSRNPRWKYKK